MASDRHGQWTAAGFAFGVSVAVVAAVVAAFIMGKLHLPTQESSTTSFQTTKPNYSSSPPQNITTVLNGVPAPSPATEPPIRRTTVSPGTTLDAPPPPARVELLVNVTLTSNLPGNTIRVLQGMGGQSVGVDATVQGSQGQLGYSECSIKWTDTVNGQLFRRGNSYCSDGGITMFGVDNSKIGTHVIIATATDAIGEMGSGTITVYVTP